MDTLFTIQSWVLLALGVVLLAVEVFALIEAVRGQSVMYQAHGKLTKPIWIGITAVAVMLGFSFVTAPVGLPGIIAIVAAGVFLADVRPVVRSRRRSNHDGPYRPW